MRGAQTTPSLSRVGYFLCQTAAGGPGHASLMPFSPPPTPVSPVLHIPTPHLTLLWMLKEQKE